MSVKIFHLGKQPYQTVWEDMREFTRERDADTEDEFWFLEHEPVFTLGLNGKREHLIQSTSIDIIPVDRGGQVTYHGPGQLVVYLLCDINRMKLGVRDFVAGIEQSVLDLLDEYGIAGQRRQGAPGVYVDGHKIAALGLRIKKGRSYHGLSLNVDMDLAPFAAINPCGYPGLDVTQLKNHGVNEDIGQVSARLNKHLQRNLRYNNTDSNKS